ncbi:hypothetical protein JCM10213_001775 [Rhodosporidiobolus nylandii]
MAKGRTPPRRRRVRLARAEALANFPRLPLDVLRLIAAEVVADAPGKNEGRRRRELGRTLAIVCRDWLDLGREMVWRTVDVALSCHSTAGEERLRTLLDRQELAEKVLQLRFRWEDTDDEGGERDDALPHETLSALPLLLRACPRLDGIVVDGWQALLWALFPPAGQQQLQQPSISSLSITLLPSDLVEANHLISLLSRLPSSLTRLSLHLSLTTSAYLLDLPPPFEPLHLRELRLHLSPDTYLASDVLDRIFILVDPPRVRVLDLLVSGYYSALESIPRLRCSALSELRLTFNATADLATFLPNNLRHFLSSFPALRILRIWAAGEPEESSAAHAPPPAALLAALPLSLTAAALFADFSNAVLLAPFLEARKESPLEWFTSLEAEQSGGGRFLIIRARTRRKVRTGVGNGVSWVLQAQNEGVGPAGMRGW